MASSEQAPQDVVKQHRFLDLCRDWHWTQALEMLEEDPTLVNAQPAGRWIQYIMDLYCRVGSYSCVNPSWLSLRAEVTGKVAQLTFLVFFFPVLFN